MTDTQYALSMIAEECQRVQTEVGYTLEQDQQYTNNELAVAGAWYALPEKVRATICQELGDTIIYQPTLWPFAPEWFKPRPEYRIGELIKAGQFIVAEIVRLHAIRHDHLSNGGKDSGMTFEDWKAEYIAAGMADGESQENMEKHTDWDDLRESYEYGFSALESYKEGNCE